MIKLFKSDSKAARILYTALLSLAGALVALLAIGTIIGLVRPRNAAPLFRLGNDSASAQTVNTREQLDDIRVFSGLGRLRIPLSNSSILILSIAFPYQAGDLAFSEELAVKIGEFKVIANDYFSSLPEEQIIQIDEEAAKSAILNRFNSALRLGRIDALYFSDMMIIDAQ